MTAMLAEKYAAGGAREFDAKFIYKLFETNITFETCEESGNFTNNAYIPALD